MKKQIFVAIVIFIVLIALVYKFNIFNNVGNETQSHEKEEERLIIVSTNPDPLEGAVILPSQKLEVKFNKIVAASEFKHRFDPEVEHEVEAINESSGTTIVIKFQKPLELGSGYTLFILSDTDSGGLKLGQEYSYHFTTIRYKGV